jgi:hypothetical protein
MRPLLAALLLSGARATTVYVAPPCSFPPRTPCGDDENDGASAESPLATLTKARDALRAASADETKRVELAGGVYEMDHTLELTAEDSGTVWTAAAAASVGGGDNVTLSGGEAMNPGWLKQVMNTDVLSQLPSNARKHVRKVELWEHFLGDGVTLGNFTVRGSVNSNAAVASRRLKRSRTARTTRSRRLPTCMRALQLGRRSAPSGKPPATSGATATGATAGRTRTTRSTASRMMVTLCSAAFQRHSLTARKRSVLATASPPSTRTVTKEEAITVTMCWRSSTLRESTISTAPMGRCISGPSTQRSVCHAMSFV